MISGGARGITALVAAELARTWRPTLLMVGTTPLPDEQRVGRHAGMSGEAEIKAALHARLRHEGQPASPAQIESAYQSLRRAREVRENLEMLRQAGSTVAYAQADVRDPAALARVLDRLACPLRRARRPDPRRRPDQGQAHPPENRRIVRPRARDQALRGPQPDPARPPANSLKFTVLFSSIAGRFGNVGQSDYAAANEILNKLAHWLDRRSAGRVLSVIWGPWSGVGMVSQLETASGPARPRHDLAR